MPQTVQLDASAVGGLILAPSGPIQVPASGRITVQLGDVVPLLAKGCNFINVMSRSMLFTTPAARAASAGRIVASTAFSNGTKTIANQPDVPRQLQMILDPGTSAVTAGNLALRYQGADGVDTTENINCATAASTILTAATSKGVVSVTSAIVTGVAGGASPGIQIDDTNALACMTAPNYSNFNLIRADIDGVLNAGSTVASSAACVTPSTAPNGTHTYSFFYKFDSPSS